MELHLALDQASDLTAQIVHQIRDAIQGGRLEAGARMPPTRLLGTQLGVARKTVTTAYGPVKAPRQVITGRRFFDQGNQQGVLGRHASGQWPVGGNGKWLKA
ncbi:hypothetical protein AU476_02565, partial [Cupriavidus sp. UYMSc13B]